MFEEKIIGSKVDLQLDFKAPAVSETDSAVKKARAFFPFLRHNVRHVTFLSDFCGIKDIVQMKETMQNWRKSAQSGEMAVYYIYPHNEDQCVGCFLVKRLGNLLETGVWVGQEHAGHSYSGAARQLIEKSAFEKGGVQEIISRFYLKNPSGPAIEHNLKKMNYQPCSFKAIDSKAGDENIFKTYHKTKEMYTAQKMMPFARQSSTR